MLSASALLQRGFAAVKPKLAAAQHTCVPETVALWQVFLSRFYLKGRLFLELAFRQRAHLRPFIGAQQNATPNQQCSTHVAPFFRNA